MANIGAQSMDTTTISSPERNWSHLPRMILRTHPLQQVMSRMDPSRAQGDIYVMVPKSNIGAHFMDATTISFTGNDWPILCYVYGLQEVIILPKK
ncbi:hypothetical protein J5N97_000803 [Dioscorea zingiberensis]|uniref:Uncharacterized protein n=1 Tax=Dioscorea zingiberensis TaxID=325984 RepID=A0A9D5BUT2_9LILI|nr:hypothetical protein J5N97_000803 [Dioscorea zingiberensis]